MCVNRQRFDLLCHAFYTRTKEYLFKAGRRRQDAVHSHKRYIGIIGIVIGKCELGLEASAAAKAFPFAVMLLSNVAAIHDMHRDVESRVRADARTPQYEVGCVRYDRS